MRDNGILQKIRCYATPHANVLLGRHVIGVSCMTFSFWIKLEFKGKGGVLHDLAQISVQIPMDFLQIALAQNFPLRRHQLTIIVQLRFPNVVA